jgi:glucokinase
VILVGDIGGTHARFALVRARGDADPSSASFDAPVVRQASLDSASFPSLLDAVRAFLGDSPPAIFTATLGVAGPVVDNKCTATNLPWVVDGDAIGSALGIERVTLLNDLVALSIGALHASREKLRLLQGEAPAREGANIAVLAAGTGLGEAALVWSNQRHVPLATEGGHTDFAPRDELEMELLRFLRGRFGRVSYERILSGRGIGNLYDFFRDIKSIAEPAGVTEAIRVARDRNAEIATRGLAKESDACARALDLFASLYGAEAGNLALKTFATGGVFVGGGIAASMIPLLESGAFLTSFCDKGRFSSLMKTIPVAVVLDSSIGLAGSAYHALHAS